MTFNWRAAFALKRSKGLVRPLLHCPVLANVLTPHGIARTKRSLASACAWRCSVRVACSALMKAWARRSLL